MDLIGGSTDWWIAGLVDYLPDARRSGELGGFLFMSHVLVSASKFLPLHDCSPLFCTLFVLFLLLVPHLLSVPHFAPCHDFTPSSCTFCLFRIHYLALPYLTLPYLILPCLTLLYITLPYRTY